jgi:hypothetical protein
LIQFNFSNRLIQAIAAVKKQESYKSHNCNWRGYRVPGDETQRFAGANLLHLQLVLPNYLFIWKSRSWWPIA